MKSCAVCLSLLAVFSMVMGASRYSCDGSLTSGLPASSYQSSSHFSETRAAHFAKLNRKDGGGGWSAQLTDRSPWLQLDLRARMEVTAVATQGRHGSHDWVSGYNLLYSDSAHMWKQYKSEDRVTNCGLALPTVRMVSQMSAWISLIRPLTYSIFSTQVAPYSLRWTYLCVNSITTVGTVCSRLKMKRTIQTVISNKPKKQGSSWCRTVSVPLAMVIYNSVMAALMQKSTLRS